MGASECRSWLVRKSLPLTLATSFWFPGAGCKNGDQSSPFRRLASLSKNGLFYVLPVPFSMVWEPAVSWVHAGRLKWGRY